MCTQSPTSRGQVVSAAGLVYSIDFHRENKTFYPGELVTGKVLFSTSTRDPLQGLKTRLVGIEEIFWGSSFVASSKVFLSLDCYAPHVPAEESEPSDEDWFDYEFRFTLPMTNLPQSFVGAYGSIRYYVETVLSADRLSGYMPSVGDVVHSGAASLADQFRKYFTLKPILDLNSVPDLQTPAFLLKDNSDGLTSFFRSHKHPIRFTLDISKRGFAPAIEGIPFTIVINNGSSKTISTTSLKLIQEVKYSAGQISRDDVKTVHKVLGPNLPPKTLKTWEDVLVLPENLPISGSSYSISIKYKLRVTLKTNGFPECVKGDLSIVLGTIPIDDLEQSTSLQPRSSSFTSTRDRLSPGLRRHRHRHRNSPVAILDLSYRHSISALPTYDHVDRPSRSPSPARSMPETEETSLPPSYTEATQPDAST